MASKVTVIILNWNGLRLLQRCLPSVVASTYSNLELVVADNASTDGSVEWIQKQYPHVRIIAHPDNWGFCKGNNEAIRQTSGDYAVLLNNDVEVDPDWLDPLAHELDANPSVAAVQPKLLDAERLDRFEYAGGAGGHMDRFGFTFVRGRLFFTLEADQGQYDDKAEIFWATGAAIMLRRSAVEVSGLLDERFQFHMEEIDLCWRLRRLGFGIRVVPASRVFHLGGSSLPRGSTRKTYYNFRNSLLMLENNLPRKGRFGIFAARLVLDFAATLRFLITLKPGDAWAVVKGYRDFLRMRKTSGLSDSSREPTIDVEPSYGGSIIVDYYVLRRRRFSELPENKFRLGR
jgi:GT2 family glycosyltransferase